MTGQQLGICRLYRTSKGCHYGARCKFSHGDGQSDPAQRQRRDMPKQNRTSTDTLFIQWRKTVPLDIEYHPVPLQDELGRFFQLALRLVNEDAGTLQEVVKRLSNGGLHRIKELCERAIDITSPARRSVLFKAEVLPFLRILTHPTVTSSPVLEEDVLRIYSYIGHGTVRFGDLFGLILEQIVKDTSGDLLIIPIVVLKNMLDHSTDASTNPKMKEVAKSLADISARDDLGPATQEEITNHLKRIDRRLHLGLKLKDTEEVTTTSRPKFVFYHEPPGGRHDNDHGDICDIRIMPTIGEIRSVRREFLPPANPEGWHISDPVNGLIDRQFRLLREDSVGPLRDAVRDSLDRMQNGKHHQSASKNAARTYSYNNVQVIRVETDLQVKGMVLWVSFDQPLQLRNANSETRTQWWDASRRLATDALVCLLDPEGQGDAVFCTVAIDSRKVTREEDGKSSFSIQPALQVHRSEVRLRLSLVDSKNAHALQFILKRFPRTGLTKDKLTLVEFPGTLLPSFSPVLQALQVMKQRADLPFADFLAPTSERTLTSIDPPNYAQRPGFSFNLRAALKPNAPDLLLHPSKPFDLDQLQNHSTLDHGQAVAIVQALTSRFACIQGPPGTGKSFCGVKIIKVLLDVSKRAALGPILMISYTNHALDQMLENLVTSGVNQIIRIGSRSKSELLKSLNLNEVVRDNPSRTKAEGKAAKDLKDELERLEKALGHQASRLATSASWDSIKSLAIKAVPQLRELIENAPDEDGFQKANRSKNSNKSFSDWLHGKDIHANGPMENFQRVKQILLDQREKHFQEWIQKIREPVIPSFFKLLVRFLDIQEKLADIKSEEQLRCLQQAKVVGITSSGLARNLKMLQRLRSKVVVIEEAGELLEAHSITSLLPSVEHVILIGDHEQLRPQINNYDLSRESSNGKAYSLDVSLFERLVNPVYGHRAVKLPYTTLETQRRMHPSISNLIRSELYPALKDHSSVKDYPEIEGMKKRLFWLDHSEYEGNTEEHSTSHWNDYEIEMTLALVGHLIKQGKYGAEDLAVITPYLGQLKKLREKMKSRFAIAVSDRDEDDLLRHGLTDGTDTKSQPSSSSMLEAIRLATVDNFQGEEAKCIIVSLVRSNPQQKVGFLRTSNRINVLLSRAKHGMYIIGNAETARSVPFWAKTIETLESNGCLGTSLELVCRRHQDTPIEVKSPSDFARLSPEGGCQLRCNQRLNCGHTCIRPCHSNLLHSAVKCLEPCARLLKCKHPCPRDCWQKCEDKCKVSIDMGKDFLLPCGHYVDKLPCWFAQDVKRYTCRVKVQRKIAGCGHVRELPCHTNMEEYSCDAICDTFLECGHNCKRPCFKCRRDEKEDHGKCRTKCARQYTNCSHSCNQPCHPDGCQPCQSPCTNHCDHSKCSKICSEPCAPCVEETCTNGCEHSRCTMPCAAPCNYIPCSKRCTKILECGHQCPTICSESCPNKKYCQICASEAIRDMQVDQILGESYREIELDENPVIIPPCGHIITIESLDGWMDIRSHYDISGNEIQGISTISKPFAVEDMKYCATCRGSLADVKRYARISRRAFLDEATKKFISWSNKMLTPLIEKFLDEQDQLVQDPPRDQLPTWGQLTTKSAEKGISQYLTEPLELVGTAQQQLNKLRDLKAPRHASILKLHRKIQSLKQKLSASEQPFQRVYDRVETLRARGRDLDEFKFGDEIIQTGVEIKANALLIRCELVILQDILKIRRESSTPLQGTLTIDFDKNILGCLQFIQGAKKSKQLRQGVEGKIFVAKYIALWCSLDGEKKDTYLDLAQDSLESAAKLCIENPGTTIGLENEIKSVRRFLNGGTFYQSVTSDELKAVYAAMSKEFSGTGHWYRCENLHAFTIGECGMPMEQARCPECGASIGGAFHQAVAGVQAADDIERQFGNLHM